MANTQLVLWDWNGTLLDDREFTLACLNALLKEFGYPQRFSTAEYLDVFGFPIEDYYRKVGFDFEKHPFSLLAERFMAYYNGGSAQCAAMPDAVATLSAVRNFGIRQVILSASRRDTLIEQVSARSLQGYFDELLGLGDIYGKSKVQAGLDWMRAVGEDPAGAVMIGDTLHDAEVAKALGTRCILCTRGHQSEEVLRRAGCPVVHSLAEVLPLLNSPI